MTRQYSISYPRRVLMRHALKFAGRTLASVLARPTVTGVEHLPEKGPLILVGNHAAFIEVPMMVVYTPHMVELMGAGDIPMDPRYAWLTKLYGMIPIKRGSMDREGMNLALDILAQGGVVGLFPEGGIWESSLRQARNGVAWLSNKANAPVVPIGFGGIEGAIARIMQLKRPRLTMNIGEVIPPISTEVPGKSRKEALADGANLIMDRIKALLPEEERAMRTQPNYIGETFSFDIFIKTAAGHPAEIPAEYAVTETHALGKLFHRPVMMDVFLRNLRLPVKPLVNVRADHESTRVLIALDAVLGYLNTNPHFFGYRFGTEEGEHMMHGLKELRELVLWVAQYPGYTIRLKPLRRYTLVDTNEEVVEDQPAPVQEI